METIKKIWPGILIILVAYWMIKGCGSDTKDGGYTDAVNKYNTSNSNIKTENTNPVKEIKGYIESLKGDDLKFDNYESEAAFKSFPLAYKIYTTPYFEYKDSKNDTLKKLSITLGSSIKQSQIKNYPKVRKAYASWAKNKLWEENIEVQLGGKSNEILTFTAGMFSSNKEIKVAEEMLHEMFHLLRFKQVRYKWYRGDDEFTYYTIDSKKDSEIE
jgi:hypothetical protein